jgi:hypothetical protein
MSNNRLNLNPYLETGDPKTSVETTMYRPGELGSVYITPTGKRYQKVQLENSTLTLAPAVKLIFFWKDRTSYVVTFDIADSEANRNAVAGLLESGATVPTAGQYFWALQEAANVTATGTTTNFLAGMVIVAHTGSGHVNGIAAGTAPTCLSIGTLSTAVDLSGGAGDVVIDLNIPSAA